MYKLLLPALLLLTLSAQAQTQTSEEKGLSITQKANAADNGWQDMRASMKMILRNSQGETSERTLRNRQLEVEGDGDKALNIFDSPSDVMGTAFLSHTHATEADDQWLYLPALKRVKRISSNNKSGPFMGSEFAYEDITSQEVDKYSYKWLRDEMLDGGNAYVIERYPAYKHSGYSKQIIWLDQEKLQPLKIDFYDRKDSLLKSLTAHDYQLYQGKYWRAGRMEMVNHQTHKSTIITWTDYQFANGFSDRDFDTNTLKRIR